MRYVNNSNDSSSNNEFTEDLIFEIIKFIIEQLYLYAKKRHPIKV